MRYVLRRLALAPIPLLLVTVFVFVALRLSGDPAAIFLGPDATPEQLDMLRQQLGFDDPLPVQYLRSLWAMLHGDFGTSLQYDAPAIQVVAGRLGATLELLGLAMALALALGVPLGIAAAHWRGRLPDAVISVLTVFAQSMPTFWVGLLFIQLFALKLGWLPTSGSGSWQAAVMPAVTLAIFLLPNFLLVVRVSVIEAMSEMFVTTARARGASRTRALLRHAVPNAMNALVSMIGLQLGKMMGGAVVTETIFSWPGIGRMMIGAIAQRDVPVVMAGVMLAAVTIVLANLLVDVVQALLDPRIGRA